jgi:hypothetical protein
VNQLQILCNAIGVSKFENCIKNIRTDNIRKFIRRLSDLKKILRRISEEPNTEQVSLVLRKMIVNNADDADNCDQHDDGGGRDFHDSDDDRADHSGRAV